MSRPEHSEAASYYFTYIDRIPQDNIVGVMESQLEDIGKAKQSQRRPPKNARGRYKVKTIGTEAPTRSRPGWDRGKLGRSKQRPYKVKSNGKIKSVRVGDPPLESQNLWRPTERSAQTNVACGLRFKVLGCSSPA
jgi:hypothetical protein